MDRNTIGVVWFNCQAFPSIIINSSQYLEIIIKWVKFEKISEVTEVKRAIGNRKDFNIETMEDHALLFVGKKLVGVFHPMDLNLDRIDEIIRDVIKKHIES